MPSGLLPAALLLCALACGTARDRPQDAVVARPVWVVERAVPSRAPFARTWTGPAALAAAWKASAGQAGNAGASRTLVGQGEVALTGPRDGAIDATLLDVLVVSGAVEGADVWAIRWWAPGEDPAHATSYEERVRRSDSRTLMLRLPRMASTRRGELPRWIAGIELCWKADDPTRQVRAAIDTIALLSDHDTDPDAATVRHGGLVAPGVGLADGDLAREPHERNDLLDTGPSALPALLAIARDYLAAIDAVYAEEPLDPEILTRLRQLGSK